jgi:type VI secretion system lysozyme-related protein
LAELTTQERLQPSLLDRLADDAVGKTRESREQGVISAIKLRDSVTRDISWLLNCVQMQEDAALQDYPEVQSSVLNFGIPDLAGLVLSGVDTEALERKIRAALIRFEPRLKADSLQVIVRRDKNRMNAHALVFDIDAEMWAQPIPLNLYLKTEVDLESGAFKVLEGVH